MKRISLVIVIIILAFVALAAAYYVNSQYLDPPNYHIHVDFKVVMNGNIVDFNKPQYMRPADDNATDPYGLSEWAHMHDFDPHVIHFHKKSFTLGDFFRTIGMDFNSNCFYDGNTSYCTGNGETLQFYVNGAANNDFGNYHPNDLDKILIFYGYGAPSPADFNLTNQACYYSKNCDTNSTTNDSNSLDNNSLDSNKLPSP